jgi:predicted CopG family antitoxin
MATIRDLKKDIHYVTTELVIECLVTDMLHDGKHESKLSELVTKLIEKKQELLQRINDYRRKKEEEKASDYFKAIRKDFHDLVIEIVDEVSKLNK